MDRRLRGLLTRILTMKTSTMVGIGILVGLLVIFYVKESQYNRRVNFAANLQLEDRLSSTDMGETFNTEEDTAQIAESTPSAPNETTTQTYMSSSTYGSITVSLDEQDEDIAIERPKEVIDRENVREDVQKIPESDRKATTESSYSYESDDISTTVGSDNIDSENPTLTKSSNIGNRAVFGSRENVDSIRESHVDGAQIINNGGLQNAGAVKQQNEETPDVTEEYPKDNFESIVDRGQKVIDNEENTRNDITPEVQNDIAVDTQRKLYDLNTLKTKSNQEPVTDGIENNNKPSLIKMDGIENNNKPSLIQMDGIENNNKPSLIQMDGIENNNKPSLIKMDGIENNNKPSLIKMDGIENNNKPSLIQMDGIENNNKPSLIQMQVNTNLNEYLKAGVENEDVQVNQGLQTSDSKTVQVSNEISANNMQLDLNNDDYNNEESTVYTDQDTVDDSLDENKDKVRDQIQLLLRKYSGTKDEVELPRQNETYTQRLRNKLVQTGRFDLLADKECKKRLPQAIVIGVMKAGTEAFATFLGLHPQVAMQFGYNAIAFFSSPAYQNGLDWYRERMMCSTVDQITMEKSPQYFSSPVAPQRIYSMNANVKLIVLVREPIARAHSHFLQQQSSHPERLAAPTFEECVFNKETNTVNKNSPYIQQSTYSVILKRWLHYFPYKQNLIVVDGDTFKKNPTRSLSKTESFLNIDHSISRDRLYFNEDKGFYCLKINSTIPEDLEMSCFGNEKGRTHPPIDPTVYAALKKYFQPFNQEFMDMTRLRMSW